MALVPLTTLQGYAPNRMVPPLSESAQRFSVFLVRKSYHSFMR